MDSIGLDGGWQVRWIAMKDKRASLILLADKPYGRCNCKPNTCWSPVEPPFSRLHKSATIERHRSGFKMHAVSRLALLHSISRRTSMNNSKFQLWGSMWTKSHHVLWKQSVRSQTDSTSCMLQCLIARFLLARFQLKYLLGFLSQPKKLLQAL